MFYKKVLLRERKRHTACRVASVCSAALSPNWGVPPANPNMEGGTLSSPDGGAPIQSRQMWSILSSPDWGYPYLVPTGVPHPVLTGGTLEYPHRPDGSTVLVSQMGVSPCQWDRGIPHWPDGGTPCQSDGGTPSLERMGITSKWEDGGTPLVNQMGYPPRGVNRLKILPSVILRMQAVIILLLSTEVEFGWKKSS